MVTLLSEHASVLEQWILEIRDLGWQQDRARFRRNMERIGEIAAYEISKRLEFVDAEIQTPLGTARCRVLKEQPVLATILRAGIPLQQGLANYFDHADQAFIAAYRKHHPDGSFDISLEYLSSPELTGKILLLSDPMLATGASLVKTIQALTKLGAPREIHVVAAIASKPGIAFLEQHIPAVSMWVGALDEHLDQRGYIVPGLGDAGDLAFGSKIQH